MLACGGNRDSGKLYLTLDCDPPGGEWRADTSPMIPHGEWTEALSLTGPGDNEFKSVTFGAYDTREAYAVTLDGRVYYSADVLRSGSWSELRGLRLRDRGLRKLGFGTALYSLSSSGLRRMGINPITGANWLTLPIPMATDIYQLMTVLRYPADENIMHLASSSGLFSTRDDGREWIGIDGGLPHAAITGITHDAGYLYVSTYGRGLWRKRMGCI